MAASKASTTRADAQAALDQLNEFRADINDIRKDFEAELAIITAAQAVADDADLEEDAAFEVPISIQFSTAKALIT